MQKIHIYTVIVMLFYVVISGYIQSNELEHIHWSNKIYEVSFGFCGFFIAIMRALLVQDNIFLLPTIYIAVLYGFAVVFYFKPHKSFWIYSLTSITIILLLPIFQPGIIRGSYIEDIISNNMIAWIVSVISYQRYLKEFVNQITISKNNLELKEKTVEIEKVNERLKHISTIDVLTNMYNRRKLDEHLDYEYNRSKRYNSKFSVILLDIDFFKSVNDTYGHNVGDQVLIEMGSILKSNTRASDLFGRWGGEEFLIICSETNIQQAANVAEKMRKRIEAHEFKEGMNITCSFGVASYENGETAYDLISRVDQGLYEAKEKGKNFVSIMDEYIKKLK